MTLLAIRAALKTALETTDVTRVYDKEPDAVQVPCFVIGNPGATYDDTFEGELTYTFPVVLLFSRAADSAHAIAQMDPYIQPDGVPAALTAVQGARTVGFNNFGGGYIVGENEYVGVTFEVQVLSD